MSPNQEQSNPRIDVMIDGPISHQPRALTEVCRPTSQNSVELIPDFLPWPHVARLQHLSDLQPDARNTLLGRTHPQIPMAIFPVALRAERISQKVKLLLAGLPDAGLRFVHGESNP